MPAQVPVNPVPLANIKPAARAVGNLARPSQICIASVSHFPLCGIRNGRVSLYKVHQMLGNL